MMPPCFSEVAHQNILQELGMLGPRLGGALLVGACILSTGCGSGGGTTPPPTPKVTSVTVSPTSLQLAVGQSQTLVATVTADAGLATTVTWSSATPSIATVSAAGVVTGVSAGSTTITATSTADATKQATAAVNVGTVTAISLTLGQVTTPLAGASVQIAGGSANGEYAVISFNASPTPSANVSLSITGTGIDTAATIAPTFARTGVSDLFAASYPRLNRAFDAGLRARERRELTRLIPSARAWQRSGANRNAVPATVKVGDIIQLNSNATRGCDSAIYKAARVAAISNKAIVVADTTNPAGGYTDADYQSIAVTFDTLVDPLDELNFGAPSDIDSNGRIVLYFTRAVNELTPRGSQSFVGGFFYARDLFPQTATQTIEACAASNVAEMFYLLVPDPTGVVNGNTRTKAFVTTFTIATLAHEFQHLINAARRLYVNTAASDFEEVWLNEGLSHSAEELLFYRVSGLAPRQNINVTTIRQSQAIVDAFNNYAISNFGRYHQFLLAPSTNSPYNANDSLATRGSTWSLLRYLVDHNTGTPEQQLWFNLVNSTTTGVTNLSNVFGSDVITRSARDWATSVFTDDLSANVAAQWQQPSWNFRSIYPALQITPFPLQTLRLQNGQPTTVTVMGGGVAFLRFVVNANQTGTVQFSSSGGGALPATVELTVVRTK